MAERPVTEFDAAAARLYWTYRNFRWFKELTVVPELQVMRLHCVEEPHLTVSPLWEGYSVEVLISR